MTETEDSKLFNLTRSDIENHPTGVIVLDRDGTIVQYNQAEAKLARRENVQTVGLNFWKDVAPCTAVQDFKGRFDTFAHEEGNGVLRFDFNFRFHWGHQAVGITMVRKGGEAPITLLVTVKSTAS